MRDEGTEQGSVVVLDFVGAGVTATVADDVATISIPQGTVQDASATTKGLTKLSSNPTDPANPIALGTNGGTLAGALDLDSTLNLSYGSTGVSALVGNTTILGVTSTAAPRTITLPVAQLAAGRMVVVKDQTGGANLNPITIDTEGAELIDGQASIQINTSYGSFMLYCDGTNWFVVYAIGGP